MKRELRFDSETDTYLFYKAATPAVDPKKDLSAEDFRGSFPWVMCSQGLWLQSNSTPRNA
jgi:hypothetical protein